MEVSEFTQSLHQIKLRFCVVIIVYHSFVYSFYREDISHYLSLQKLLGASKWCEIQFRIINTYHILQGTANLSAD